MLFVCVVKMERNLKMYAELTLNRSQDLFHLDLDTVAVVFISVLRRLIRCSKMTYLIFQKLL